MKDCGWSPPSISLGKCKEILHCEFWGGSCALVDRFIDGLVLLVDRFYRLTGSVGGAPGVLLFYPSLGFGAYRHVLLLLLRR